MTDDTEPLPQHMSLSQIRKETSNQDWSPEWPTEPGKYWFYGYTDRDGEHLRLLSAAVWRTSQKGVFSYVTEGRFIYRAEGARGLWRSMEVPEPPTEAEWSEAMKE